MRSRAQGLRERRSLKLSPLLEGASSLIWQYFCENLNKAEESSHLRYDKKERTTTTPSAHS